MSASSWDKISLAALHLAALLRHGFHVCAWQGSSLPGRAVALAGVLLWWQGGWRLPLLGNHIAWWELLTVATLLQAIMALAPVSVSVGTAPSHRRGMAVESPIGQSQSRHNPTVVFR